jgi:3-hydroxybenzoate 6-monooxygenase
VSKPKCHVFSHDFFCKLIRACSFSVIIDVKSQKIHMVSRMLIAGGGIAGLASALALARQGISCTVLEQSETFSEIGAGIQLGPNALRALTTLGLRTEVETFAFWPRSILMRDALTGKPLHQVALGSSFENRFRERYACVHRGDLLKILLEACRHYSSISLCPATKIESISNELDFVRAHTIKGKTFEAEGLIGADGLWSVVRSALFGIHAPRFSGDIALRALVPCSTKVPGVTVWLGPQLHVVAYPVKAGALLNIVAICKSPGSQNLRGWEEEASKEWLGKFKGHHPELDALLSAPASWTAWALHDRDPIQSWAEGRIALVGDAAHPCLQYLAQGACLALEDAVAIAQHLAAKPCLDAIGARDALEAIGGERKFNNPTLAFQAFSEERHARGARMIRSARRMGQMYHAAGPLRQLRNLGMRFIPDQISREAMAWIYEA